MTWDSFRAAEHFTMRNARLLDRHRFAHLFQAGPPAAVRSALSAYRNLDGGYGNGLEPDLRGHSSQPAAVELALRHLDELGHLPQELGQGISRYLATVANPDSGLPQVLPGVHYTEAAPWHQRVTDFSSRLDTTAMITGLLHKHGITHPWRDHATAYCWKRIDSLGWTDPHEAIGICCFLQYVPDRHRADVTMHHLFPMIRAVIDLHPRSTGHIHTPWTWPPTPTTSPDRSSATTRSNATSSSSNASSDPTAAGTPTGDIGTPPQPSNAKACAPSNGYVSCATTAASNSNCPAHAAPSEPFRQKTAPAHPKVRKRTPAASSTARSTSDENRAPGT